MITFLIWSLTMYGLSNILVYGSILNGFRNFIEKVGNKGIPIISPTFKFVRDILRCMMCTPFHLGYLSTIFFFSPTHVVFSTPLILAWFLDANLASGVVWAINSIIEWFETNKSNNN
jgi:hypothetical protein